MSRIKQEKDSEVRNNKKKGTNKYTKNPRRKVKSVEEQDKSARLDKGQRDNDPNWYFTSPELAGQAAQLSFQNVLGFSSIKGYEIPSILRLDTCYSPGVTYDFEGILGDQYKTSTYMEHTNPYFRPGKAGINLMAAKLYTTLSSFTGRTASYAPQDVAMMILAIAAIAEWSEMLRRCFGLALTYNYRNRTLPLGLLASMGLNTDDFAKNISIYRMRFNVAISRINQIPLLDNIAYIKKCREVYQNVYQEDTSMMSQLFYYMPAGYGVLDEVGDEEGSILRYKRITNPTASSNTVQRYMMSDWLDALEEQINAVLESSTLNFIYADLLNMANKLNTPTWQFDYLAENYIVVPVYNANALLQLHNLTIMGQPARITDDNITAEKRQAANYTVGEKPYITDGNDIFCDADKNNIVYNPAFPASTVRAIAGLNVVDMPTDAPSVEDRIEALRWQGSDSGLVVTGADIGISSEPSTMYVSGRALPDHYVTKAWLFSNVQGTASGEAPALNAKSIIPSSYYTSDWGVYIGGRMSQFREAPLLFNVDSRGTELNTILGDLKFYTTIDYEYIKRLLNITYVGLFDFRV